MDSKEIKMDQEETLFGASEDIDLESMLNWNSHMIETKLSFIQWGVSTDFIISQYWTWGVPEFDNVEDLYSRTLSNLYSTK